MKTLTSKLSSQRLTVAHGYTVVKQKRKISDKVKHYLRLVKR